MNPMRMLGPGSSHGGGEIPTAVDQPADPDGKEEEEDERARLDARGEQEQDARGEQLDHAADTTDAEALAAAAALYAQQRQKHDDDFYTAATAASGMPPWMEMDRSKGWQVCDTTKSCLSFSTFFTCCQLRNRKDTNLRVDCFIIAF
jgi:hypothetical protein